MDLIKIKDLEVFARHGVFKEENSLGQKFLISVEMETDTREAGKTDKLEKSVNYGEVCELINEYTKENIFKLLEKLAESLAELILITYSEKVKNVKIEIKKPWAPIMLPIDTVSVEIERGWREAYIALGSNMGDKLGYLKFAIEEIRKDKKCRIEKISDFIETEPVGGIEQDNFLNGCMKIKTLYEPIELLENLNTIEAMANRKRTVRWGPRTLDLDIIFYEKEIIESERLTIPHIETVNREFVLRPLSQIAPYYKHPIYGKTIKELLHNICNSNID